MADKLRTPADAVVEQLYSDLRIDDEWAVRR